MELCIYPPRPAQHRESINSSKRPWQLLLNTSFAAVFHRFSGSSRQRQADDVALPGAGADQESADGQLPIAWSCSEESIMKLLKARDPQSKGLPNRLALRLLLQLLHWSPHSRPTPSQILLHAYFTKNATNLDYCQESKDAEGWC